MYTFRMGKLSSGFTGSSTRWMGTFDNEIQKRLDVFTDDFQPPGTSDATPGIKAPGPYAKKHDDLAAAGNASDQEGLDEIDRVEDKFQKPIKKPGDQFPGVKSMSGEFNYKGYRITVQQQGDRWKLFMNNKVMPGDFRSQEEAIAEGRTLIDEHHEYKKMKLKTAFEGEKKRMSAQDAEDKVAKNLGENPEAFDKEIEKKMKHLSYDPGSLQEAHANAEKAIDECISRVGHALSDGIKASEKTSDVAVIAKALSTLKQLKGSFN